MLDLVVLAADNQMQQTFEGLLERHVALGFRRVSCKVFVHPHKDSGCRLECAAFLRQFLRQYQFAIVAFDHEGSGADEESVTDLEASVEKQLECNGWSGRCRSVVIDPELEIWAWGHSTRTPAVLGWTESGEQMREWLEGHGFVLNDLGKPLRPKEALIAMLKATRTKHEASLYRKLASRAAFQQCTDRAFGRLLTTLRSWFPLEQPVS